MSQDYSDNVFSSTDQVQTNMQQIEDNFAALKSAFSGASAPPDQVAGMWWFDTNANILKLRNEDNNAWLSIWDLANNKPVITNLSGEITLAMMAASASDAAAGTASLRSLGTGATTACAGNDSRLSDARTPTDGTVSQAKLKTSSGAVSTNSSTTVSLTLPGGEYGFYPQICTAGGADAEAISGDRGNSTTSTSYVAAIGLRRGIGYTTAYAGQRYVTSSGEVFWIFILRDKQTKAIISAWAAPDHPSFGNGGKPALLPHPFGQFDPARHEIVVVNPSPDEVAEMEDRTQSPDKIIRSVSALSALPDDATVEFTDKDGLWVMTPREVREREIHPDVVFRAITPDRSLLQVILDEMEVDDISKATVPWPEKAVTVGLPAWHKGTKMDPETWRKMPDGEPISPVKARIPRTRYHETRKLVWKQ